MHVLPHKAETSLSPSPVAFLQPLSIRVLSFLIGPCDVLRKGHPAVTVRYIHSVKREGVEVWVRCCLEGRNSPWYDYADIPWKEFREIDGAIPAANSIHEDLYEHGETLIRETREIEPITQEEQEEVIVADKQVTPSRVLHRSNSADGHSAPGNADRPQTGPKIYLQDVCDVYSCDGVFRVKVIVLESLDGTYPRRRVEEIREEIYTWAGFERKNFEYELALWFVGPFGVCVPHYWSAQAEIVILADLGPDEVL
ncbi:hypothetical protein BU26DRAFT_560641 [Trematosphaeria pertusa]|uniref:Uncharacterized protein n=1 Tax=Trematosphaeria pertusa TaxID=390896 RepID=A0A6A6IS50_9PLEO|nr:uncharacterized protein BU26DRAFT_560641 [Trematosphaeria pertusa]KAF2253331.1 hypothetical protein BU26DRAFT_560641 [Trematosphaeria pertusa]